MAAPMVSLPPDGRPARASRSDRLPGDPRQRRHPRWLAALRALRFLLIWPIIAGFQRQSDRSLRWRLVGSHLATVFVSIVTVAVLFVAILLVVNWRDKPLQYEPAAEAQVVAASVEQLGWQGPQTATQASALLSAYVGGQIAPNLQDHQINLNLSLGEVFTHVRAISLLDPAGTVVASSDPSLVGQPLAALNPAEQELARRALGGETGLRRLAVADVEHDPGAAGAYPVYSGPAGARDRRVVGAIVESRMQPSIPSDGLAFASVAARYAGIIGLILIVIIGLPAILVALVIGINRARMIARPVNDLARAAERLASGDLSVRVWVATSDEVARLARAFNRMGDQLQQSIEQEADARSRAEKLLATNRDLVANVSHDLRTPVALIRGHIEALADDPARFEAYTEIALRESDRLEELVNDLFQLARIDAQGLQLDHEPFDAGDAVQEAVASLVEPTRRDTGITMRAEVPPAARPLTVIGDRARLVQVLQNLLRNAIRYTPEGGIILASAEVPAPGNRLVIRVRDTGAGIAPDDLERVFDRFFRSDRRSNVKGGGAGLGLSIARQSVEAMGGTIGVESTLGEGTTFTIVLPFAGSDAGDGVAPPTSALGASRR